MDCNDSNNSSLPNSDEGEEEENNEEQDENCPNKRLPFRLWNAFEEISILELWRINLKEVMEATDMSPVYRKIAVGMHARGINVNTQECRRKIITLRNKYRKELLKQEQKKTPSEWRLFQVIQAMLEEGEVTEDDEDNLIAECEERFRNAPRCSHVLKDQFTLAGIRRLRKKNQILSINRRFKLQYYLLKKEQLRACFQAYHSWQELYNVLEKQVLQHGNDRFPRVGTVIEPFQKTLKKAVIGIKEMSHTMIAMALSME